MTDKTREDFEAWAQSRPVNLTKQHDGIYESSVAAFGFRAYQAATQHSAARIAELEAEVQALRRDAERGRFMLKHGSWYRNDEEKQTRMAVLVPHGSDLSCYATRVAAIDAAIEAERGGA